MRSMRTILAALLALSFNTYAQNVQTCNGGSTTFPKDLRMVCSATWQLTASCTGDDLWDKWKVSGQTASDDAFIRPWADTKITVIGYELVKLHDPKPEDLAKNDRLSWFMIGSGIYPQPDAMLWLGPGHTQSQRMWPSGMGQVWPSKAIAQERRNKSKYGDILDLHGACFGGGQIKMFLTVYYFPHR